VVWPAANRWRFIMRFRFSRCQAGRPRNSALGSNGRGTRCRSGGAQAYGPELSPAKPQRVQLPLWLYWTDAHEQHAAAYSCTLRLHPPRATRGGLIGAAGIGPGGREAIAALAAPASELLPCRLQGQIAVGLLGWALFGLIPRLWPGSTQDLVGYGGRKCCRLVFEG
jgi:hypothetical protein